MGLGHEDVVQAVLRHAGAPGHADLGELLRHAVLSLRGGACLRVHTMHVRKLFERCRCWSC